DHHRGDQEGDEARAGRHPVGPLRQELRARQPRRQPRAQGRAQGRRGAPDRAGRQPAAGDDAVDRQEQAGRPGQELRRAAERAPRGPRSFAVPRRMPMPRALLAALLTVSLAACGPAADEPPPLESDITPGVTEPATDTAAGTAPDSPDRPLPGETAVPPTDQPGSEEPGSAPSDEADACGAGKLGR